MTRLPYLAALAALVAVSAAVGGAAIGEAPILTRGAQDSLPDAQPLPAMAFHRGETRRPPDHYPLETPHGTIEVAELALHGRLRGSVHAYWQAGERDGTSDLAAIHATDYDEATLARLAHEEALIAYTAHPPREPASGPEANYAPGGDMQPREQALATEPEPVVAAGPVTQGTNTSLSISAQ